MRLVLFFLVVSAHSLYGLIDVCKHNIPFLITINAREYLLNLDLVESNSEKGAHLVEVGQAHFECFFLAEICAETLKSCMHVFHFTDDLP